MKIFLLIKKSGNLCGIFVISTPAVNFGQNPELVENYHNKRVLDLPVLAVLVFTKRWPDHRHSIVRDARSGLALASLGGWKYRLGPSGVDPAICDVGHRRGRTLQWAPASPYPPQLEWSVSGLVLRG